MPNYCHNTVTLTHTDESMIARAKTAFERSGLFNEFVPLEQGDSANEKWGTKWDVCGSDGGICDDSTDTELKLFFSTAWQPPIAFYDVLVNDFGFGVDATYHESGMCFCGYYEDGNTDEYEYASATWHILPEKVIYDFGLADRFEEDPKPDEVN